MSKSIDGNVKFLLALVTDGDKTIAQGPETEIATERRR